MARTKKSRAPRPMPKVSDLRSFGHAVAGHDGTLSDSTGRMFIKPCTDQEIAFYEATIASSSPLFDFIPKLYGTLSLTASEAASIEEASAAVLNKYTVPDSGHHVVDEQNQNGAMNPKQVKTRKIKTEKAIALKSGTYGFKHPNILDVKLGVRLYADDASEEKKARFDKITEETTHKELGFRIAGMKVWQGHDEPRGGDVDEKGMKIYDKVYGREKVNVGNVVEAFRDFFFEEKAGIDEELGKMVAGLFFGEVEKMQKCLEGLESRMFSASILFIFEGDGDALRKAMEEETKKEYKRRDSTVNGKTEAVEEDDDEDGDSDSDDDDEPGPKIFSAKLIDFAHAEYVPGQGPDENSLIGIRSVAKILRELCEERSDEKPKKTNGVTETDGEEYAAPIETFSVTAKSISGLDGDVDSKTAPEVEVETEAIKVNGSG